MNIIIFTSIIRISIQPSGILVVTRAILIVRSANFLMSSANFTMTTASATGANGNVWNRVRTVARVADVGRGLNNLPLTRFYPATFLSKPL